MINKGMNAHAHDCHCFKWKPVFAGALTAIGLSFLLNLFSVAIGLTAFTSNSEGVENVAIGGLVATSLGIVVAMFASGWLAGYLGNRYCVKRHLGALYGFLTWCVALIVTVLLAEQIQHYITFYTHFISGTAAASMSVNNAGVQASIPGSQADKVAISAYILFSLFFLSAVASCLGGHCGMVYVDRDDRE